jgi:hypothetical protein
MVTLNARKRRPNRTAPEPEPTPAQPELGITTATSATTSTSTTTTTTTTANDELAGAPQPLPPPPLVTRNFCTQIVSREVVSASFSFEIVGIGLKRGLIFLLYLQISMIFQSKKMLNHRRKQDKKSTASTLGNRKSESNQ